MCTTAHRSVAGRNASVGHYSCKNPQMAQWATRLIQSGPGPVRAPWCWGLRMHLGMCVTCVNIEFLSWHMAACSPSWHEGTLEATMHLSHQALPIRQLPLGAGLWRAQTMSLEGLGLCFLLFLFLFQLKMRKHVTLFTNHTDCEDFSHP